jgi:hypothetical protein
VVERLISAFTAGVTPLIDQVKTAVSMLSRQRFNLTRTDVLPLDPVR